MKKSSARLLCITGYAVLAFLFYSEPLDYNPHAVMLVMLVPFWVFYLYITGAFGEPPKPAQKQNSDVDQEPESGNRVWIVTAYITSLVLTGYSINSLLNFIESKPVKLCILLATAVIGLLYARAIIRKRDRESTS